MSMKIAVAYDKGQGIQTVDISPAAICGWELQTKQKISNLGTAGLGYSDLISMLYLELKKKGTTEGLSQQQFTDQLLEITPEVSSPTQPPEDQPEGL